MSAGAAFDASEPGRGDGSAGAVARVLRVLRKVADEAQWTQVIASIAAQDPEFASGLAAAWIAAAPNEAARKSLGVVPARVSCRAERTLTDAGGGDQGRVDLVFSDDRGDFTLLCELKLHSDYGNLQLERYITALTAMPARRKALTAVTTLQPQHGEDAVAGRPEWLGSVRWADVYDRMSTVTPADPALAATWRAILRVMRETGDFGPMDLKNDVVLAWARRDEAELALRAVLNNLTLPALAAVREAVGTGPGDEAAASVRLKGKTQQVFSQKNRMFLHYAVPRAVEEARLRLQVIVWDGLPYFTVEARYEHPLEQIAERPDVAQATAALIAANFECGRDATGWYWTHSADPADWLDGPETVARMLSVVRQALPILANSGIFDALAELHPSTLESSVAPGADEG